MKRKLREFLQENKQLPQMLSVLLNFLGIFTEEAFKRSNFRFFYGNLRSESDFQWREKWFSKIIGLISNYLCRPEFLS